MSPAMSTTTYHGNNDEGSSRVYEVCPYPFFFVLLTFSCRYRGLVAHHHPQFTPPPPHSLEREMEAITIPPSFKSDTLGSWHHHPTSLTQMQPGGHTCPPPSSHSLECDTDLDTYVFDYFMKLYSHIKL